MKRPVSLLLVCAMLIAFTMAGCATNAATTAPAATTTAGAAAETTTAAAKEVVELNAVMYLNPEIELKDNPIVAEVEKKTGIRLNIEAPSSNDYWDRVKVIIAAGDTPDLFMYGSDVQSTQWAQQGVLAEVTDLVKDYPNLMKNIDAAHWKDTEFFGDGKLYGVTRPSADNQFGYLINKKWLTKLNLEAPRTVDEFVEVCRAFTTKDPDGNGKDDTFGVGLGAAGNGISGNAIWSVDSEFITAPYNLSWFLSYADKDGQYRIKPFTDRYIDYLELMKGMYAEGILDREFITQKGQEDHVVKFAQERVGIVGVNGSNYATNVIEKYNLNPNDFVFRPALALDDSSNPIYMQEPCSWLAFYMGAKSDKIKDSLRLLDWGNSEEGFLTMNIGLPGVHYNSYDLANRKIDRTPEQLKAVSKVTSNYFSFAVGYQGRNPVEGGSSPEMINLWQIQTKAAYDMADKYKIIPTKVLNGLNIDFPDDVVQLGTLEARYVTGQIKIDELQGFLKGYETKVADYQSKFNDFRQANPIEVIKATTK